MDTIFQEASEAEEIPHEGLTTPGTALTSPWMDVNKSPDNCYVNTVTQGALPAVNANKNPDSTSTNVLTQAMSPADKVDSWFASTPARPSHSSTSRPNTRDTALTSLAGDQNQLSDQKVGDVFLDAGAASPSIQDLFRDSVSDTQNQPPLTRMDPSTDDPGSPTAEKRKFPNSHLGASDPFFDSVPKGPSQLSTSRWNARVLAFDPWKSTRGHAPASPWDEAEAPFAPAARVQENPRPRLSLRIPNTFIGGDNFRSAPQMATHSENPDPQADAPYTADSVVPAARRSNPSLQHPPPHQATRREILNPAARPFQSKFSGQRAPARRTNHTLMQPTAASHTNSRTWTSSLVVEKERWQRVEESLGRMNLLRSSVAPKTMRDWLAHQRDRTDARRKREQRRLEDLNTSLRDPRLPPPSRLIKVGPAFRGRLFEHKNYGSVLVLPSVWARTYKPPPDRPNPLWPCVEEMKEEGDERNTSGFRRFPALPRVPGNDTVQYKLKAIQPLMPFDTIWELPTRQSVEASNERYSLEETEKMEAYLGRSLLDALDCITEDGF